MLEHTLTTLAYFLYLGSLKINVNLRKMYSFYPKQMGIQIENRVFSEINRDYIFMQNRKQP